MRDYNIGRKYENKAIRLLRSKGLDPIIVPHLEQGNHPKFGKNYFCDILIGNTKIEVKYRTAKEIRADRSGEKIYRVSIKGIYGADILIAFITFGEKEETFIIPNPSSKVNFTWPQTERSRINMQSYHNAWHLIAAALKL